VTHFVKSAVVMLNLAGVVSAASPRALIDPPQGKFYEQYYSLYLGDVKCGWARFDAVRKKDTIISQSEMLLQIGRGNINIELTFRSSSTETVEGRPLAFRSEISGAGLDMTHEGTVNNGVATMRIAQGGQSVPHRFTLPKHAVMSWGQYLKSVKAGLKPGTRYEITAFNPQLGPNRFEHCRITIVGPEQMEVAGRKIKGTKALCRTEKPMVMEAISLLDDQAHPLVTQTQFGVWKLILVAADKTEAVGDVRTKELFTQSFIKLDRPLKTKAKKPLYLTMTFTGKTKDVLDIPETGMQKIISRTTDKVTLRISRPAKKRRPREAPTSASTSHLADSSYLNLKDPLLIKLANSEVESGDKPLVKARKLCRFVSEYVITKDLSVAFASAGQVARSKQGDCSEHAVLLAALGRIVNIPTRAVIGLAYSPKIDPYGAFVYHMWTQFLINGRWMDFDPALGQVEPDNTHIALAISDLTDESFIEQAIKLIHLLGQLKIEQAAPARARPASPKRTVR